MSAVLGLSGLYHDAAAALIVDGQVVAAAAEERFSRIKHDASLPHKAAAFCLEAAGLTMKDLDHVVWYERPLRKYERILVTQLQNFPRSLAAFRKAQFPWLTDKLWMRSRLCRAFGITRQQLLFGEHHLSHAASTFYTSGLDHAAVLVADGVGEWSSTTLYRGHGSTLTPLAEVHFPHSIGMVYSTITAFLGFRVNNGEYKVMGLAAYGEPRFVSELETLLQLQPDGSFTVNTALVSYQYSADRSFGPALEQLLGRARRPGEPLDLNTSDGARWANIAASLQVLTERALLGLANHLHDLVPVPDLCFAGGVALNSVANRVLLQDGPFDTLQVHPAAGDAGGALGAALWAWHDVMGHPRLTNLPPAGLGQEVDVDATRQLLTDLNLPFVEVGDHLIERAASDIAEGRVVGWVQGRFEWGPRALGHRSILADPTRDEMKDHLNQRIKFRETFRPFAPAILEERLHEYVALPTGAEQLTRHMLMVGLATDAGRAQLPAAIHVDGSTRVQAVNDTAQPLFAGLLRELGRQSGVPASLNTSFNLKGEPMVATPLHALATLHRCEMDAAYIGPFRVTRGHV